MYVVMRCERLEYDTTEPVCVFDNKDKANAFIEKAKELERKADEISPVPMEIFGEIRLRDIGGYHYWLAQVSEPEKILKGTYGDLL